MPSLKPSNFSSTPTLAAERRHGPRLDPLLHAFGRLLRDPARPLLATPRRTVTAGDLDGLARAAGERLRELHLPPGAVVGLAAPNGSGFLASLLALRAGGLAALLFEPRTPPPERLRAARALGASALLSCRCAWPRRAEDWSAVAMPPGPSGEPASLLGAGVVKLTSGSIGAPRGIVTPSEALVADEAALATTMGLSAADRLLATIPMSHSYGLSSLALPALVRGTLLVLPEGSDPFAPFAAAECCGTTVFPTVPAYLQALLALSHPPPRPRALRLVLTAGAPLQPATACRFRETFGLPVHVFYGASECGGICYDREGGAGERGTVGTPVDGVSVTLGKVDAPEEESADCGIVRVAGPAVADGYLPEPDPRPGAHPCGTDNAPGIDLDTARTFPRLGARPAVRGTDNAPGIDLDTARTFPRLGGGRFTTGDLASWKDGELVLRGRADHLINIKGKKIDPHEVEAVLALLPEVEEAAVLPLPAAGGEAILRAVVASRRGRLSRQEVLGWCRAHLAPHKVPRSLVLVRELPRTERGKLDRRALLALEPGGRESGE